MRENGAAIDLLPTLADMADVPLIGDKPLDGVSLRPLLTGESEPWEDRMIFLALAETGQRPNGSFPAGPSRSPIRHVQ